MWCVASCLLVIYKHMAGSKNPGKQTFNLLCVNGQITNYLTVSRQIITTNLTIRTLVRTLVRNWFILSDYVLLVLFLNGTPKYSF